MTDTLSFLVMKKSYIILNTFIKASISASGFMPAAFSLLDNSVSMSTNKAS